MLGPDDRLFFIHVPKTAGTSLIPLIDRQFATSDICPAQLWREFVRLPQEQLSRFRLFRGHFGGDMLNPFLPRPPVCMTMLRHPVALSRSTYKFVLREPGTRVHDLTVKNNMGFAAFLEHPRTSRRCSDRQVRQLTNLLNFSPGVGPILDDPKAGEVDDWVRAHRSNQPTPDRLKPAMDKLESCPFFGLVERFDESMDLMCWTFGWPPIGVVHKYRVTRHDGDLSPDVIAKIEAINEHDLALYEFAERLFEERLRAMHRTHVVVDRPDPLQPDPSGAAAVAELVDRAYRAKRRSTEPPPRRLFFQFDQPIPGWGWHRREASSLDGTTFCWTGPSTTSTLDLHVERSTPQRLTVRLINALTTTIYDSFRVRADGATVAMERVVDDSSVRVYQGELPVRTGTPFELTRLEFCVDETTSRRAIDAEHDDARDVGVAVNWVDVRPVSELPMGDLPDVEKVIAEHLSSLDVPDAHRRRWKWRLARLPVIGGPVVRLVRRLAGR